MAVYSFIPAPGISGFYRPGAFVLYASHGTDFMLISLLIITMSIYLYICDVTSNSHMWISFINFMANHVCFVPPVDKIASSINSKFVFSFINFG